MTGAHLCTEIMAVLKAARRCSALVRAITPAARASLRSLTFVVRKSPISRMLWPCLQRYTSEWLTARKHYSREQHQAAHSILDMQSYIRHLSSLPSRGALFLLCSEAHVCCTMHDSCSGVGILLLFGAARAFTAQAIDLVNE